MFQEGPQRAYSAFINAENFQTTDFWKSLKLPFRKMQLNMFAIAEAEVPYQGILKSSYLMLLLGMEVGKLKAQFVNRRRVELPAVPANRELSPRNSQIPARFHHSEIGVTMAQPSLRPRRCMRRQRGLTKCLPA